MRRIPFVVLFGSLAVAGPAAAQVANVVVAATGGAASGGGTYAAGGDTFATESIAVSADGRVGFTARLAGTAAGSGLFRSAAAGGAVTAVAREGEAAPAAAGAGLVYGSFGGRVAVNAGGQVALTVGLDDPGGVNSNPPPAGAFRFPTAGGPVVVALERDPAGAGEFTSLGGPVRLGAGGHAAFAAERPGANGLFRRDPAGTLTTTTLVGQTAPGSGGRTYAAFNGYQVAGDGRVAFTADLSGSGSPRGLFLSDPAGGSPAAVAVVGQAAPAGRGTYTDLAFEGGQPAVNAAGQVGFKGTTSVGDAALFRYTPGAGPATAVVLGSGDAAPGTGGQVFASFSPARINNAGRLGFMGEDFGIFYGFFTAQSAADATPVALAGQQAPGLAAGVALGSVDDPFDTMPESALRLNNAGGLAFWARLSGPGVTAANDTSLWYGTSQADLTLVAREGVTVIGGKTLRGGDDLPQEFDLGDTGLAWRAAFADGTFGVIYSDLTPVPEPAAVLGVAAAGLVLCSRLRRKC